MISVHVDAKINELMKALGDDAPRKVKKEVAIALNNAAKATKNQLAKEVAKELAIAQKEIKSGIAISEKATQDKLGAVVTQKEGGRISLKRFGAKQTAKGVRYRISKTSGARFIKSAFMPIALGQHVFKRTSRKRKPIDKLHGPSPWGVTVQNKLDSLIMERDIEPELIKQLDRRIRAVNFKKSQG